MKIRACERGQKSPWPPGNTHATWPGVSRINSERPQQHNETHIRGFMMEVIAAVSNAGSKSAVLTNTCLHDCCGLRWWKADASPAERTNSCFHRVCHRWIVVVRLYIKSLLWREKMGCTVLVGSVQTVLTHRLLYDLSVLMVAWKPRVFLWHQNCYMTHAVSAEHLQDVLFPDRSVPVFWKLTLNNFCTFPPPKRG